MGWFSELWPRLPDIKDTEQLKTKEQHNSPEGFFSTGEEEKRKDSLKREVETANKNMLNLVSRYPKLSSHIWKELKKDPEKNQLFLLCWYIAWETAKYLKEKDKVLSKEASSILEEYVSLANEAKQKLDDIEFVGIFKEFAENIEMEAKPESSTLREKDFAFKPQYNWDNNGDDSDNNRFPRIGGQHTFTPLT